jgi:hypothetical protein
MGFLTHLPDAMRRLRAFVEALRLHRSLRG